MIRSIEQAVTTLQAGKSVVVIDENREGISIITSLAKNLNRNVMTDMATHGSEIKLAITEGIASKISVLSNCKGSEYTISNVTNREDNSIEAQIEAIQAMIQPNTNYSDFVSPGLIKTVIANPLGVIREADFKEAAVDLAILAGSVPASVYTELVTPDGELLTGEAVMQVAETIGASVMTLEELVHYRKLHENHIKREVETVLPSAYGEFKIIGYSNNLDDKEHIAIVKGDVDTDEPVMARIHSECLTGDIFGSYRCDCGPQLHAALDMIEANGRGVIVYMRQEGRGIGLINKLKAYKLQDQGRDTHEANVELGFKPDAREYYVSAQILQDLGVSNVQLLTNNPDKITALEECGVPVKSRLPLQPDLRKENARYMETKREKFGHLLDLHS